MNNFVLHGSLALDSRRVKPGDLFIAVQGEAQDGRHFIQDAITRGAVAVITEPLTDSAEQLKNSAVWLSAVRLAESSISNFSDLPKSVPIIQYSDLKNTVGYIASRFYHDPSHHMPIIGITGTNGKTSCSHFIAQLSSFFAKPCGVVGTLGAGLLPNLTNFDLTTPDAITLQGWLAKLQEQQAQCVAMEVTSHALAQGRVAGIQFHTAIFTNLTRDHLDYHQNFEAYFQAKQKLFTDFNPKYAILNLDDPVGRKLAAIISAKNAKQSSEQATNIIGITTEATLSLDSTYDTTFDFKNLITTHNLQITETGITATLHTPWGNGQLQCPLLGRFNLSNILASIAALCLQGFPFSEILNHVPNLKPVAGRMNRLGGGENEPSIVIDYAHTPDALAKVLAALRPHCTGKLWCVFGCGGDRDPGKRPLMAEVAEQWSDHIIVTQDNPRTENKDKIIADILKGFSQKSQKNILIEPDRAKAIQLAIERARAEDLIVIAGKGHETYQIIQTEKIPFLDEAHARIALDARAAIETIDRRQI